MEQQDQNPAHVPSGDTSVVSGSQTHWKAAIRTTEDLKHTQHSHTHSRSLASLA